VFFCIQGGQAWFGPVLNSAVHVVMYAYYGLSVIPSLRDKLWWKKYITMFQLVSKLKLFIPDKSVILMKKLLA